MSETKIYKPIGRALFDFILGTDFVLFLAHVLGLMAWEITVFIGVPINLSQIVIWYLFFHRIFSIELTHETIQGPSKQLRRIVLKRLDLNRKLLRDEEQRSAFWGYYEIVARDGTCMRLWFRFLGKRQVYKILKQLRGPKVFRDSSSNGGPPSSSTQGHAPFRPPTP